MRKQLSGVPSRKQRLLGAQKPTAGEAAAFVLEQWENEGGALEKTAEPIRLSDGWGSEFAMRGLENFEE